MNDPERFNELVETLLGDRSPAAKAGSLEPWEQRMLVVAQRIRGSHGQRPDPGFLETLRRKVVTAGASSTAFRPNRRLEST